MSELYNNLIQYSESDYYPFHMPGHKRNITDGVNPYSYDITEIDGFDNLHEPQGILRIAMEEAAGFYESDKTYFLVNGSTCGILSAICGVTSKGNKILVARNCHKAVYNAVYLNELTPVYLYPEYIREFGINGGISKEKVKAALEEHRDVKAVVITSPTYEGIVSDIEGIAKIVHEKNKILIVDEAHGAHFGMHGNLPKSALALGADIVIQSLHKTLPALTQTALLHIKGSRVNIEEVERYLHIYQTSSPSYVLMSSITECIDKIKTEGMFLLEPYIKRMIVIAAHAREFTHLRLLGREVVGKNAVYDLDLSKIVISARGTGYTGKWIYDEMLNRFHIQLEMASGDYALAMTSMMDTEEGLLRLFKAMVELDRDIRVYGDEREKIKAADYNVPEAIVLKSIYDAVTAETERLGLREAQGRISAEFVYLYPPGIPIIAPGEMITNEVLRLIETYKNSGLSIHGTRDRNADYIIVMKEGFKQLNLIKGYAVIKGNG